MAQHNPINEQELNELLRSLYLEESSRQLNEQEADFVLQQEYDVAIDRAKEKKLLARLNKKPGLPGRNAWLLLAGAILLLGLLAWFYIKMNPKTVDDRGAQLVESSHQTDQRPAPGETRATKQPATGNETTVRVADTFGKAKALAPTLPDSIKPGEPKPQATENTAEKTVPYISEKELLRYKKIKEQMIRKLLEKDKGLYSHVPASKLQYAGKPVIVDAFSIRNMGISNLEYKTFLADLLGQKRYNDYLLADVTSANWAKQGYPNFSAAYFGDERYNDFPVVNISSEGARLFCSWLQEETQAYIRLNHLKARELSIRLPYDEEWIYAAREGYAKIAFEKGYNTFYDESEGLVDKAFTNRAELVKKRTRRVDTLYALFTTNHYGWSEKELADFFKPGFGYYSPFPADTIYTDRMKVFGKIGRVSEIVLQRVSPKIWLGGLSWKNKEDYKKMENEFLTDRSSPFVGFRIVVVDAHDPEYKNPFW